ncbi:MAG TPA: BatA domain-containing protein, partial [Pirellulales bacterium]|nr:BatA domain-containing protein [Pirellulales bacterium]
MQFINMLPSWWAWGAFAAVPPAIVVALYFLKLKREPLEVPSTFLWTRSIEDLRVNSLWQRMRQSLLLFLQLLLLAIVALALLRPN